MSNTPKNPSPRQDPTYSGSMIWLREKAGLALAIFASFALVALVFGDWGMNPGSQLNRDRPIIEVDGEPLAGPAFDGMYNERIQQLTSEGRELSSDQHVAIRRQIAAQWMHRQLLMRSFAELRLRGTGAEALRVLENNPPPGIETHPDFLGPDSLFDPARYREFLRRSETWDIPIVRYLEEEASAFEVPSRQLTRLLDATLPVTDLELKRQNRLDRTTLTGAVVWLRPRTDLVPAESLSTHHLQKVFESLPDSFMVPRKSVRMPFVRVALTPSSGDSHVVRSIIDSLAKRLQGGEDFFSLALNYSEDFGSRDSGGALGNLVPLDRWDPVFAARAAQLQVGGVSEPFSTRFGWHIVKCRDRKTDTATGAPLMSLSHILVKVEVSPQTEDSLESLLEGIRQAVLSETSTFEAAATEVGLVVDTTPILFEGQLWERPEGPVVGAVGWVFRDLVDPVSEIVQNEAGMYLLGRSPVAEAGRSFDASIDQIRAHVNQRIGMREASQHLQRLLPRLASCGARVSCIDSIDPALRSTSLDGRPLATFLEPFGYASPTWLGLVGRARGNQGQWMGPIIGERAAAAILLTGVNEPPVSSLTPQERSQAVASTVGRRNDRLTQAWMGVLRGQHDVEDRVDLFYGY